MNLYLIHFISNGVFNNTNFVNLGSNWQLTPNHTLTSITMETTHALIRRALVSYNSYGKKSIRCYM